MSGLPLVSVVMPCYNAAATLPWALASLVAQTYAEWECIVVDDGSADRPERVVEALGDGRVRLIRLAQNQGRAAARQTGLDHARGELLAKLDADDWYYPEKLARQVDALRRLPDAGLVSTGIAIEDAQRRLLGVRARGPAGEWSTRDPLARLSSPPLAHAASMVRMEIAKRHGYSRSLRRSEDADFLLRVLQAHRYCVLHDVLYAYSEYRSISRAETLDAYGQRMRMFWSYRRRFPAMSALRVGETLLKLAAYRLAFAVGVEARLVQRRSDSPSPADIEAHRQALARVTEVYARLFGATGSANITERSERYGSR